MESQNSLTILSHFTTEHLSALEINTAVSYKQSTKIKPNTTKLFFFFKEKRRSQIKATQNSFFSLQHVKRITTGPFCLK